MRQDKRIIQKILSASIIVAVTSCSTSPVSNNPRGDLSRASSVSRAASSNLDIARTEFSRGNYGNAIQYLEQELASKPASVAALNGLGACYDQLGRYDVAQRYYFRALDLAPESSQTLSNIGYSYLQQGRNRDAVAILELALQKNDGDRVAANNLQLARAGVDEGVEPLQVASSTNNGSQADAIDFLSLLSLLQSTDSEVSAEPERSAVAVVSPLGTAPEITRSQPASGLSEQVSRVQNTEAAISAFEAGVIENPQGSEQVDLAGSLVEEPAIEKPLIEDPVIEESSIEERLVTSSVPEVTVASAETHSPGTLTPANEPETASLALVTETAAIITPVFEPQPDYIGNAAAAAEEVPKLTLTILDAPQLNPALASDVAPSLAALAEPLNLVIENGNGVRGIARATSNWLQGEKLDIKRVGDAESFDYAQTVIYYRPELAPYAQEIANSLNLSCELQPSTELAAGADVQVVLGHDFASLVNIENGGLSFEARPNSDYLIGTIRLEVANGNGVNGMAARLQEYFRAQGNNVVKISDADSYEYQESRLYYRKGTRIAAEAFAASLPMAGTVLIETERLRPETDARLVIGSDFIPFDNLVSN